MSELLVSIIIPIYNVELYLRECIDSVCIQTYEFLEIILIDDGSTDSSGKICNEYEKKDSRIRVIHKENEGQSVARNVGLDVCKGEYIFFLDSDDFIEVNTIDVLLKNCESNNAEVAISGSKTFVDDSSYETNNRYTTDVIGMTEAIRRMLLYQGYDHAPWAKLYKRKIWENFRFPVGIIYEDYAILYQVMAQCKKVVVVSAPFYHYRIRVGSTMNRSISEKELYIIDIAKDVTCFIKDNIPSLEGEVEYLQLRTYLKTLKRIMDIRFKEFPNYQKEIISFVKAKRYLMKKKWFRKLDKIKVYSLLLGKLPFYVIYSFGEYINRKKIEDRG